MTGKLIKHEWKIYSRTMLPFLIFIVIMTAVIAIIDLIVGHTGAAESVLAEKLMPLWVIIYFCSSIAIAVIFLLKPAQRFSSNLFGDEGYLMQTLPCSKHALILSKGIVAGIWNLILAAVFNLSIVLNLVNLAQLLPFVFTESEDLSFGKMFSLFADDFFGMETGTAVIYFILGLVCMVAFLINMMYMSVTVGKLWKKHSTLGAILVLLASMIVTSQISGLLMYGFVYPSEAATNWIGLLITAAFAVLFYFVTEIIMSRHLDI